MASVTNESRLEEKHMQEEHHSGVGRYIVVFVALLVLTLVTVVTGRMHLPDWGLALALLIATTKGTLVALYFMHLTDHKGANRLVFGVSIVFVMLMLAIPLLDLGTRFRGSNPPGSQYSDLQAVDIGANAQQGRFGGMNKGSTQEQSESH